MNYLTDLRIGLPFVNKSGDNHELAMHSCKYQCHFKIELCVDVILVRFMTFASACSLIKWKYFYTLINVRDIFHVKASFRLLIWIASCLTLWCSKATGSIRDVWCAMSTPDSIAHARTSAQACPCYYTRAIIMNNLV